MAPEECKNNFIPLIKNNFNSSLEIMLLWIINIGRFRKTLFHSMPDSPKLFVLRPLYNLELLRTD